MLIIKTFILCNLFAWLSLSGGKTPVYPNKYKWTRDSLRIEQMRQENKLKFEKAVKKLNNYELVPKK